MVAHRLLAQIHGRPYPASKGRGRGYKDTCKLTSSLLLKNVAFRSPGPPLMHSLPSCMQVKIAVWASMIANFSLCVLQRKSLRIYYTSYTRPRHPDTTILPSHTVYAAISSVSLSLLATGIDAVFDFGSNVLLFWIHRKAERLDINKWPVGGSRLETIGNIVYGERRRT